MSTTSELSLEKEIQEKGLNAPRLRPEDIDSKIVSESYTVLPSGKVVICELLLKNGFSVTGESATVSVSNFDLEIGKRVSYENARNKVWQFEGYLLQNKVSEAQSS